MVSGNKVVVLVVVIASLIGIIATEPAINDWWPELFDYTDIVFAWLFCFEYLVRLWVEACWCKNAAPGLERGGGGAIWGHSLVCWTPDALQVQ
jgi:hypothetical protein